MVAKIVLLLFGALAIVSSVYGSEEGSENPTLTIIQGGITAEDKRRIVHSMIEAQKDIKKALNKIHNQIEYDQNATGEGGSNEDSDEDDMDEAFGGDAFVYGEDDESYFREQQKKIREVRAKLEALVLQIAGSINGIKQHIEALDGKITEVIKQSGGKQDFNVVYQQPHEKPGYRPPVETGYRPMPPPIKPLPEIPMPIDPLPPIIVLPTIKPPSYKPVEPQPQYFVPTYHGTRRNPSKRHADRGSRSLDETIPTAETEQLSNPDIPSVVAYEAPAQKTVEFQLNQQQVEQ